MSSRLCAVSRSPVEQSGGSELILPCQYCHVSGGSSLSGEQRLMLALLADALNVYQKGAVSGLTQLRRLYVEAERWILADRTDGNALSFATVCDALSINSWLLRRRILDWKHSVSRQRGRQPWSRMSLRITPRDRYVSRGSRPSFAAV